MNAPVRGQLWSARNASAGPFIQSRASNQPAESGTASKELIDEDEEEDEPSEDPPFNDIINFFNLISVCFLWSWPIYGRGRPRIVSGGWIRRPTFLSFSLRPFLGSTREGRCAQTQRINYGKSHKARKAADR